MLHYSANNFVFVLFTVGDGLLLPTSLTSTKATPTPASTSYEGGSGLREGIGDTVMFIYNAWIN